MPTGARCLPIISCDIDVRHGPPDGFFSSAHDARDQCAHHGRSMAAAKEARKIGMAVGAAEKV
jgi:hypothetical protein